MKQPKPKIKPRIMYAAYDDRGIMRFPPWFSRRDMEQDAKSYGYVVKRVLVTEPPKEPKP